MMFVWVSTVLPDCPDWATSLNEELMHHLALVARGFTIEVIRSDHSQNGYSLFHF